LAIAKKGKKPHRDSEAPWFKQALKQRVKIEPIIGHLKADHRMDRCRYKGPQGDSANVIWAAAAWNMRKVVRLLAIKKGKAAKRKIKRAAKIN
jgi:IS5 family transposase